jgi:alpha/beta superfamily hydrolase
MDHEEESIVRDAGTDPARSERGSAEPASVARTATPVATTDSELAFGRSVWTGPEQAVAPRVVMGDARGLVFGPTSSPVARVAPEGEVRAASERPVEVLADDGTLLDARFGAVEGARRVVVVAHPHPLYGGSMIDPVVLALARIAREHGASTLRFDFRGVGRSEGRHGGGEPEIADVIGAVRAARRLSGGAEVSLVGYSFGSWVALQAARAHAAEIERLALVAPAVTILPYERPAHASRFERPIAIAVGDRDGFCTAPRARVLAQRIGASIAVLSGQDHFFARSRRRVAELLAPFLMGARDRIDEGALA